MTIFDPNSKAMLFLSDLMDYVKLGLMVLLYSIPLVTFGASITAGMTIAMKIERKEAPVIARPFRKAFRENFRQALPLTIGFELLFALLSFDWYQLMQMERTAWVKCATAGLFLLVLLLIMIAFYTFAGMARYELRVRGLIRNAVIYTILNFPKNLLAVGILLAGMLLYSYLKETVPVVICVVPALELWYMGKVCMQTFHRLEEKAGK